MPLVAMPLLRLGLRRGQVDRISESDFRHLVSGAGAMLIPHSKYCPFRSKKGAF